jgi:hypothetical protein
MAQIRAGKVFALVVIVLTCNACSSIAKQGDFTGFDFCRRASGHTSGINWEYESDSMTGMEGIARKMSGFRCYIRGTPDNPVSCPVGFSRPSERSYSCLSNKEYDLKLLCETGELKEYFTEGSSVLEACDSASGR